MFRENHDASSQGTEDDAGIRRMRGWSLTHGSAFSVWFGPLTARLFVNDPATIGALLSKEGNAPPPMSLPQRHANPWPAWSCQQHKISTNFNERSCRSSLNSPYYFSLDLFTGIETKRIRGHQIEVFKMMHGYEWLNKDMFLRIKNDSKTRGHRLALVKCHSRLDIRKYTFSQRVVTDWHKLPEKCINATSVNMFKNRIDQYFLKRRR